MSIDNFLLIAFLLVTPWAIAQEQPTIIEGVNVFTGEDYIENTNVAFHNGRIVFIGKPTKIYRSSVTINGSGHTIVPPLINAHTHVWEANNLKESLSHGIFANLDMHTTDEAANQLRLYNDSLQYARYYSSNAGATVPGGHGTQYGIEVPTINDTISPTTFVQDRVAAQADYIKILKEPMMATLSAIQTKAVIAEAHQYQKKAVAHVSRCADAIELTEQGVDGLVHIWYDTIASDSQLALMQTKEIFIVPTLSVIQKALQMGESQGWTKYALPFEKVLREVGRSYQQGIPILCGTDAPNFMMNYTDQLFEEMLLLSKAGLSNEAVLKSATTHIYRAFVLKEFDMLREGSVANFVMVEGNPWKDIADIKRAKRVFKKGREVK